MMHRGRLVMDVGEEDKKRLTIADLVNTFERAAGEQFRDDSVILNQRQCK